MLFCAPRPERRQTEQHASGQQRVAQVPVFPPHARGQSRGGAHGRAAARMVEMKMRKQNGAQRQMIVADDVEHTGRIVGRIGHHGIAAVVQQVGVGFQGTRRER